ncbi:MAG: hypothetical protein U9N77_12770 [Thermodesulfobacteriota bacterium]|nr:hypothetical protein [Thermodesulfobacteriota bacterium]
MKNSILCPIFLVSAFIIIFIAGSVDFALSNEAEYETIKMSFHNFIRCELTRTDAENYFNGKPFEITMINLFDVKNEGNMLIATGAVKCWVVKKYETLYAAVGVKRLLGHDKVSCFLIRKKDFSVLATELAKYPYKERCPWSQYWIDVD